MKDKRVVFMGTPEFSVPVLEMLIRETNVVLVVTQPDSYVGRKHELKFPPVKEVAIKNDIPVFQPEKIKEDYDTILEYDPDIIITCAYGQIIPKILLDTPKYNAVNVHASLLPYLRGGSPLHRCIIDGYEKTGVTIMYMAPGMDDGDIITQSEVVININDNVGIIHDKLSVLGSELLLKTLPSIFDGTNDRMPQDPSKVTFAYNIKREEEKIDFNKSCLEVHNQIRGMYPFPISYMELNDEIIKVCESEIGSFSDDNIGTISNVYKDSIGIMCCDREILIKRIKPAGKKEMSVKDYLNGKKKEELLGKKVC